MSAAQRLHGVIIALCKELEGNTLVKKERLEVYQGYVENLIISVLEDMSLEQLNEVREYLNIEGSVVRIGLAMLDEDI